MKKLLAAAILMLVLSGSDSNSQGVDPPYEVGTWHGFHTAAISYTFDDNCPNQLATAVPIFNEYDFKLTLFVVSNWSPNWSGLQNAASSGHEIASHTVSHASLGSLSDSLQNIELRDSRNSIDAHITGQKCLTIAYPNCNVGNTDIVKQYYLAARICSGVIVNSNPSDFMRISSIVCGTQGLNTVADIKSKADAAANSGGWCVYLLHAIDNDPGYSPLSSDTLRASLEYLNANPDKFWVTSFGNAAKYIRERNGGLFVSEVFPRQDSITIVVADTLDDSYYNCPLTIRRPLPTGWASAYAMQNGDTIPSQTVDVSSVQYLMFDAIPDNGFVTLYKNGSSGVQLQNPTIPSSFELHQNYPNPFNPSTSISFGLPEISFVSLKVYNSLGEEITELGGRKYSAGHHTMKFDAAGLSSGVYFYTIRAGKYSSTQKMVLQR